MSVASATLLVDRKKEMMNIYQMNTKAMTREQLISEIEFRKSILTDDASPEFMREIAILETALSKKPQPYSILDAWKRQHQARIQARATRKGITYAEAEAEISALIARRNR
jgi:Na+-transporting NADH:ubiquinone oxidoreductase subunit NqrC